MAEPRADLHIHTFYSDGTMSPCEVVHAARDAGLAGLSITDHDTIDGLPEARAAATGLGLEVITGVELSSELAGKDIHILGYGFDCGKSPLVLKLKDMQAARLERMVKMIAKLNRLGMGDITLEDIRVQTHSGAVGRLHLANTLVAKKHVPNREAAFDRYLREGASAYFPKYQQTPEEAICLIKDSGGVAVMAHPMLTQRDELIPRLARAGLDGLEAFYPNCSMTIAEYYIGLARKHNLLITGGSDAHGVGKTSTYIGKAWVDYEHVEILRKRISKVSSDER